MEFLLVVIRSAHLGLIANLSYASSNSLLRACAVYDGGVVFGDGNLVGRAEHIDSSGIEAQAFVLADYGTTGEDSNIFEHLFAPIAKAGGFNGSHFERAAQFVHHQGTQSLAIHVLGNNQERAAVLSHGLQHTHQLLHGRDLLVGNEDERTLQHGLHLLGVGNKVGRDVAPVELHTLHHIYVGFGTLGLLYGDYALFLNLAHSLGNQLTNAAIVVGRDGSHLLYFFEIFAHLLTLALDVLHHSSHGLVDTTFQVHRVGTGGHVLDTHTNDSLSQHGSGGGAVACVVVGFACHLFDNLCAHIGEVIVEFHLFGHGHTIFGDVGSAKFLVDNHVATFGAECYFHCICQRIHTLFEEFARLYIIFNLFCHFFRFVFFVCLAPFCKKLHQKLF